MFTGIVQGKFQVVAVDCRPGLLHYVVQLPEAMREDLQIGGSVSIDGICQTVTEVDGDRVHFDAMGETLRVTTLEEVEVGSRVHVERSARSGQEIGGHAVSGHVDGTCEIVGIDTPEGNHVLTLKPPPGLFKYLFNKGFVSLHGCSLTVCDLDDTSGTFRVYLIPETLRLTTFGDKKVGNRVNIEVDRQTQIMVDTIERTLRRVLADRSG